MLKKGRGSEERKRGESRGRESRNDQDVIYICTEPPK